MEFEKTFKSESEMRAWQLSAIRDLLSYVYEKSPYYRELFHKNDLRSVSIESLKDFESIPVTTKAELQTRNADFLCVGKASIIDYCSTSGTLGIPVQIPLSERDLERLAYNEYFTFNTAGVSKDDVVQLMLSLDRQFMAGIAYWLGSRKAGATIVRGGPGNPAMQFELINRMKSTVLVAVPSFVVSLIAHAFENNIDLNKLPVKKIICIGENIRTEEFQNNSLADRITRNWNVKLFSTYASTEMQTAFTECEHGKGGHHQAGLLYFEILDENNQSLPPGQYGELTITTLGVEAMPLIRYKTGDICKYVESSCSCGRLGYRISPIKGRKQQMVKYKGTSVYPQAIFNALDGNEFIVDYVVKAQKNDMGTDDLEIVIATEMDFAAAQKILQQKLQSKLRIVPKISFSDIAVIQKMQNQEGKRKISRFIDERA